MQAIRPKPSEWLPAPTNPLPPTNPFPPPSPPNDSLLPPSPSTDSPAAHQPFPAALAAHRLSRRPRRPRRPPGRSAHNAPLRQSFFSAAGEMRDTKINGICTWTSVPEGTKWRQGPGSARSVIGLLTAEYDTRE
ncbi:uncharacterized protein LOC134769661 [Penaeus indicus]|uniref:uncharacterized protein LOC134769661 n=1 Tax=Penaeus indicus TaxID=29960 RepID=UPI00300C23B7